MPCKCWCPGTSFAFHECARDQRWHIESTPLLLWQKGCARPALDVAALAYEDAGIRGLCADGRWEAALTAIRELDLSGVLDLREGLPVSTEAPDR
jgi:hypothetical protein